jgi:glycosyltransferase involved in cell wall biosynthesis
LSLGLSNETLARRRVVDDAIARGRGINSLRGVKPVEFGYPSGVNQAMGGLARAAVVVPAHNEAGLLPRCLRAVLTATMCLPIPTQIITVLDDCDDRSAELAGRFGDDVHFVAINARNVGAARASGFAYAKSIGDVDDSHTWYATTDADSRVGPDWLLRQISAGADMVLGQAVAARYPPDHSFDEPRQDHIHGASLGCRANAYWRVGGFAALESGEDVELVERFERSAYVVHRDAGMSVATSDDLITHAPNRFAGQV